LLREIRPALAALDAAADSLRRLSKWGRPGLRVGASASICQHLLPRVIRDLQKDTPQLELTVESGDTPALAAQLQAGKLDLALGVAPENPTGLDVRPAFKDELMLVCAASHPWSNGKPISAEEQKRQPLIVYQRSSLTTRLVNEHFSRQAIVPTTIMEVGNIEAIKELVKLNLGVAILAPWAVGYELAKGSLKMRPLGSRPVIRRWALMSLAGKRWTLPEETFGQLCRQHASSLRLDRRDVGRGRA
jgi:LysR family transcriptional regulator, low CO2-responsive transcriptional regulator